MSGLGSHQQGHLSSPPACSSGTSCAECQCSQQALWVLGDARKGGRHSVTSQSPRKALRGSGDLYGVWARGGKESFGSHAWCQGQGAGVWLIAASTSDFGREVLKTPS